MNSKDIIKKLQTALKNCCDLFDEIEAKNGVDGLKRSIVEYRYNGRAALKLKVDAEKSPNRKRKSANDQTQQLGGGK